MTTLSDLIARLEAATDFDRELDREIGFAVCGWTHDDMGNIHVPGEGTYADHPGAMYPSFTESLDAALTLVPKALWIVGHQEDCFARILPPVGDGYIGSKEVSATAHTPALAICIATLKAREARR